MTPPPRIQFNITNVDYKRKDPVFWIEVETNLNKYKNKQKRFPRYFSELEKLHHHLYNTLDDVLIPALPHCPSPRFDKEGQLVGRQWWLTIRLPSEPTPEIETGKVESHIQLWLDRVSQHTKVTVNEGLREFVESETGFRPHLSKNHKKSKQIIIHATENDMEPEFGQCLEFLNSVSTNLSQLSLRIDKAVGEQQTLAKSYMDLSSSWVSYGGVERNPNLFILYKSIAKGFQQLCDLERSQTSAVVETLGEEVNYEIRNCKSAQDAMQRRLTSLSEYLSSRKHTESSLRSVERLKSSINIDRDQASDAIAILENARIMERENLQRFQRIDTNLRRDVEEQYKPNLSNDLLRSIKEYAKSQLYLETKKLAIYEEIMTCL